MKQAIDAVYENGVFKPIHPDQVHAANRQHVTLVVDNDFLPEPLGLAARVYEGLSTEEIDEIEKIALDRSCFFDRP